MNADHERFMGLALEQAEAAAAHDDVPIGAVVVMDDEVIAAEHNRREELADPTAHAEILALRAAAGTLGTRRLEGGALYVTLEPCPMCAGALVLARVATCIYGCADPKAGAALSLYNITQDPRLNHEVELITGVLEMECADLLRRFFASKRDR